MSIPKIIFQTGFANTELWSDTWRRCKKSWEINFPEPEFRHVFFDDDSQVTFIKKEFPEYYEFFVSRKEKIHKADLIRYFFLYKVGGIYADLDYECMKNFYSELDSNYAYIVESPHKWGENYQNSLMASAPGNPFWLKIIDEAVLRGGKNFLKNSLDIIYNTGTILLGDVYERTKGTMKVKVLSLEQYNPHFQDEEDFRNAKFARHHCTSVYSPTSETRKKSITHLYLDILKRQPDTAGFNFYLNSDMSIEDIKNHILGSEEFLNMKREISSQNLSQLAVKYGSDKWGDSKYKHYYTQYYERLFAPYKNAHGNLLEIGIGGYETHEGGCSLRMWRDWFTKMNIHGIDIHDKKHHSEERIIIHQIDQSNKEQLITFCSSVSPDSNNIFDIIIDDGSHKPHDIIVSFETLFDFLQLGGIYVIEDTQTSYWDKWVGNSKDINNVLTTMGYFFSLCHSLNYEEFDLNESTSIPVEARELLSYQIKKFKNTIESIQFYHNLIVIKKAEKGQLL